MRKHGWTGVGLLAALVVAFAVGCGDDNGGGPTGPPITEVPESWRGVWQLHMTARLCGTEFALLDTTITQDICPGDSLDLEFPFDLGDSLCVNRSFAATERYMQLVCSGPIQEGDCAGTVTASLRIDINPTAGTLTGSGRVEVDFTTGELCPIYCVEIDVTGNRIAGDPTCPLNKPAESGSLLLEALSRARRE
jgi:hypothetical protein